MRDVTRGGFLVTLAGNAVAPLLTATWWDWLDHVRVVARIDARAPGAGGCAPRKEPADRMSPAPRRRRCVRIVAALLPALLGACAGDRPGGSLASPSAEEDVPAAGAVRAFSHLCGPLQFAEVMRRAGNLGFVPLDPARLAAAGVQLPLPNDPDVRLMVRPATSPGALAAVFVWNSRGPACELAIFGVAPAALEREFDRMIATLARQPSLQMQPLPLPAGEAAGPAGLDLRRLVLATSRAGGGTPPQVIALRGLGSAAGEQPRTGAVMSLHVARPQAAAGGAIPPPPALGPPRG